MKFAHLADCHLGGWRDEKLKKIGHESFSLAVDKCIEKEVDFVLISGDLFNTSVPSIDSLKHAAKELKRLNDSSIPCYVITGSHDHSPSGKTMVDVLEEAGLLVNVMKVEDEKLHLTTDEKTEVKLAGVYGRRLGLEREDYASLDLSEAEKTSGFKIFLFHTALEEFKPNELKHVDCQSYKELPRGFNYYAGGHVHYLFQKNIDDGLLTYPGALYPNNFKELEEFKIGHFYIVNENLEVEDVRLSIKDVVSKTISVDGLRPIEAEEKILREVRDLDCEDEIVTLRIEGTIIEGRTSDIDLNKIDKELSSAYAVLKNTNKLQVVEEGEEMMIEEENPEKIELQMVEEKLDDAEKKKIANTLISDLVLEKSEGEKIQDFEDRVLNTAIESLGLGELLDENKKNTA